MAEKEFDLIIWGASGFTGGLVVEYLLDRYGIGGDLNWAIAGRNRDKLTGLRAALVPSGQRRQLPIVIADSADPDSLTAMVERTEVVCSTVGPYARYGTPLVAACAEAGTDYCDLTGEPQWMARVIEAYQASAEASGARIVHTCGFDSIPSDLGVWYLQQTMLERYGVPASRVKGRIGRTRGTASGGTVASIMHLMEEARKDPSIRRLVADPYSLYPPGVAPGRDGPDQTGARYDQDFRQWTAPFVLSATNSRVVRRSNAVLGFPWGEAFRYDESLLCPSRARAVAMALGTGAGMLTLAAGPTRVLARRFLPKPGEGPDREQREAGFYEMFFHGIHPDDRSKDIRVKVTGDMDPGYGSTAKMLGEAAVCLACDEPAVGGGFWTPSSAMDGQLLQRLEENAGLTFEVVETE
ncbi:MAG: saccharopine dehydrogenase NADP-binding domain-containing protein [Halioglobus sp.]|jgi:short subunit dehydrogenase-like uncharacterized protein